MGSWPACGIGDLLIPVPQPLMSAPHYEIGVMPIGDCQVLSYVSPVKRAHRKRRKQKATKQRTSKSSKQPRPPKTPSREIGTELSAILFGVHLL